MKCQFCKKREAAIHFTNVIDDKVEKIHICRQCAEEKGFEYLKKSNFAKVDLIAGLLKSAVDTADGRGGPGSCPNCGTRYTTFKKVGRLGCPECYEFFQLQLLPLLRSIHGDTRHQGKAPGPVKESFNLKRKVIELKEELARAIKKEEYERAAELRDEIKSLEESGGSGGK